jgi:hypothetical protein
MYTIDHEDALRTLDDLPRSSIGAPLPLILSDEHTAVVAYYEDAREPTWDGRTIRIVDAETSAEPTAIVSFHRCRAIYFGAPNDEAFAGHPLAGRGLRPYSAVEVLHSSWIRQLERMNSVHPYHRQEAFASLHHYVLSFHDSTFECVARGYEVSSRRGPIHHVIPVMLEKLRERTKGP